ncbi:methyltransferase domain-containing protein [Alteromonas sediminis]|uniref:Methyltransferase domain-containing protein n=1 Tax=Alteromonas sediminis TaxID=2259342 RepID=A0A3N5YK05_9ALTE|nr:methyltransferase domain-containing protein [Alteromonas sediminis]RPJ65121.1 methyltransferase domain-containing protein [Alteromonas sediminis]
MSQNSFSWLCPSCRQPLHHSSRSWTCIKGHQFDCAKEGYVNLMLAQHKNSKQPGDSKAMVAARRSFLESGNYAPLANKMAEILLANISTDAHSHKPFALFDAGCGEGYYLNYVQAHVAPKLGVVESSGVDISKFAVQKAAKQYKELHFAVASTYAIPVADDSQDLLIQVFAPSSDEEVHRIIKPGGFWLRVNPAADHLHQLKALVYDKPKAHDMKVSSPQGFKKIVTERLRFNVSLDDRQSRESLLMMTPFYWQISEQKKAHLLAHLQQVEADFLIELFQTC